MSFGSASQFRSVSPFFRMLLVYPGYRLSFPDIASMATIPRTAPCRHRLTVSDFHRMGEAGIFAAGDRVELIDGEVIDMSPIGAIHAAIVDCLVRHLGRNVGDPVIVRCQNPIRLDDSSEPEPDIALLRPRSDGYMSAHPGPGDVLVVIEVADTSLAYDLGVKVPLYARHGIPEVWVIDAATRQTRIFRDPSAEGYRLESTVDPEGTIAIAAVINDIGAAPSFALASILPPQR